MNRNVILGVVTGFLTVCAADRAVADHLGDIAVAPFYAEPDDDRMASGRSMGIIVSFHRPVSPRWGWEAGIWNAHHDTGNGQGTDYYQLAAELDAVFRLRPEGFSPTIWLGGGVVENDVFPNDEDSVDAFGRVGADDASLTWR